MSNRTGHPSLGLVIPCFNEQEVLPLLFRELERFAGSISNPVFVLFVDDGSTDRTFELLREACAANPRYASLQFSRNFGHQTAVTAGLQHIRGDVVAVLDADLQDPLSVLPQMIEKWREGNDVVYGIRRNRKEGLLLRAAYSIFYRILKRIANVDIPLDAGDFALLDRKAVDWLNSMPEHNRFVRGLRGWIGFQQVGIPYDRDARAAGQPKYGFRKLFRLAMDGLISFSAAPLRLASWIGALSAGVGFLYLLFAVASAIFFRKTPPGWASLAVLFVFFGGIQLFIMGIIGEYVGRVFEEVKRRPHYITHQSLGWINAPSPRTITAENT